MNNDTPAHIKALQDWQPFLIELSRKRTMSSFLVPEALFQHFRSAQRCWHFYDKNGEYLGSWGTALDGIIKAKGQMWNPVTKIWSVLDEENGRIIDGKENGTRYSWIDILE